MTLHGKSKELSLGDARHTINGDRTTKASPASVV